MIEVCWVVVIIWLLLGFYGDDLDNHLGWSAGHLITCAMSQ